MNVNDSKDPVNEADDADLGALLRAAGPRAHPPADMQDEVRAAVEAEWRAMTAARARRRRYTNWAAAAGIAVAAVGVWIARPLYLAAAGPVASVARIDGFVEYRSDRHDQWAPLAATAQLRDGDELRTGSSGRVALQLASGVQLRLDNATRVAFNDLHRARLRRGGLYVDSGVAGADDARALEIDTPAGAVRHLGTQYEARVANGTLRVAVREGLVSISGGASDIVGRAGQQVTLQAGEATRSDLAVNDDAWAWIGSITPPFAIEGRSVDEFLTWAARETGRQVVYASPEAAQRARAVLLKGSVAGLTPDAAVTAVLSTTNLQPTVDDRHIRVQ
jgi:ferric-dicitrate binding protein FerR (iron transport regulator)